MVDTNMNLISEKDISLETDIIASCIKIAIDAPVEAIGLSLIPVSTKNLEAITYLTNHIIRIQ